MKFLPYRHAGLWLLLGFLALTAVVYWPGLSGGWLFDDFPNIVDNQGVQPHAADVATLFNAALSSPSSEFKRPLASLSFAANYLANGLDPWGWKAVNLVIHLLNGLLVFVLAGKLLGAIASRKVVPVSIAHLSVVATLVAGSWLLLPVNLTAVLYVVQRMESIANVFVLLGLIGYVAGRQRMLACSGSATWRGWLLCSSSLIVSTAVGLLAKETAVMLPLYAALVEWIIFSFDTSSSGNVDRRIVSLFVAILLIPMLAGLAWLIPGILKPAAWATRDFTLDMRLLSEARIVVDYMLWTIFPTADALSFYHDDFRISTGLLHPGTTLACMVLLAILVAVIFMLRKRQPIMALGLALFFASNLLTATVLPLELIFEHRNYFASFGLLLIVIPPLVTAFNQAPANSKPAFGLLRSVLLGGLLLVWTGETALTVKEWSSPIGMAESLAARAPMSPRAQYELGRTYILYSHYDPASPFTKLAYAPLERAAALPDSSILPEQALIFMNARMGLPVKDAWWNSLIAKLKAHDPGVQDDSSLAALTECMRDHLCDLSSKRMLQAFLAALSHPDCNARLLAMYSDFAWNVIDDKPLGMRMADASVKADPSEPAYRITQVRMLAAMGSYNEAELALQKLRLLNYGGRLNDTITDLQARLEKGANHTHY